MPQLRLMAAAGTARTPEQLEKIVQSEAVKDVTGGSLTHPSRSGNEGKTFDPAGINSIGMPNAGKEGAPETISRMQHIAEKAGKEFRLSVAADNAEQLQEMAAIAQERKVTLCEINYGCPNVLDAGHQDIWSFSPERMLESIHYIRREYRGRLAFKMSLFSNPSDLVRVAHMLEVVVSDPQLTLGEQIELVLSNTFAKGLLYKIDENTSLPAKPLIDPDGGLGGVSGKCILPMVLGNKESFFRILGNKVRYIMVGGIEDGASLAQHVCAGGDAFQINTAYYKNADPRIFSEILEDFAVKYPRLAEPYLS